ncbi:MAG: sulfite exporter TauE/SafE family protein [Fimbriimonas sp.]
MPLELQPWQWALGALIGVMVGLAKTGVPGFGILVVPMMAMVFTGRTSVGALLPMLIFADFFAVASYRQHTQWGQLKLLAPWVVLGMAGGTFFLWRLGLDHGKDWLNPVIGGIVLLMLSLHLVRGKLGEKFAPTSSAGVFATGSLAGFTTLVSNAAGPVMGIYLTALGLAKKEFMGTTAWYFLIFNCSKLPIYFWLTAMNPEKPMLTSATFGFDLVTLPFVAIGALGGRKVMALLPERIFTDLVLGLAALAALKMIFS